MTSSAPLAGKYRLLRPLGKGSMGEVWAALHTDLGREVALKLIYEGSPELATRLKREAQACGRLEHPNIVRVYDIGETESGDPFLVMELLVGETLAERLARRPRLDVKDALTIAADVARALGAAHQAGVIHRDLKPANVFLCALGGREVAKVLDFGVSKIVTDNDLSVTNTGALVGSPAYMSPEQARALRDIDARADLWSVGVLLYEMLAGARPFTSPTVVGVVADILAGPIPSLAAAAPGIDPRIDAVVRRCMTRDLEQRMPTAAALIEALSACMVPGPAPRAAVRSRAAIEVDVVVDEASEVDDDDDYAETIARPAGDLHAAFLAERASRPAREPKAEERPRPPPPSLRGAVPPVQDEPSDDEGETAVMRDRHMLMPFLRRRPSAPTTSTTQPLADFMAGVAGGDDGAASEDMPTAVGVPRPSRPLALGLAPLGQARLAEARLVSTGSASAPAAPPSPRAPPPDLEWGGAPADPVSHDLPTEPKGPGAARAAALGMSTMRITSEGPAVVPPISLASAPRAISFGAPPPVPAPPPSRPAADDEATRMTMAPGWEARRDAARVLWMTAIAGLVVGLVVFAGLSLLK